MKLGHLILEHCSDLSSSVLFMLPCWFVEVAQIWQDAVFVLNHSLGRGEGHVHFAREHWPLAVTLLCKNVTTSQLCGKTREFLFCFRILSHYRSANVSFNGIVVSFNRALWMKGTAHVFVLFSTNPNAHAFGYATNNRVLCRVLVASSRVSRSVAWRFFVCPTSYALSNLFDISPVHAHMRSQ